MIWRTIYTLDGSCYPHQESQTNLLTDSFIMALRRFIARRGSPQEIYSDNGINFRGTEKELERSITDLDQDNIKWAGVGNV